VGVAGFSGLVLGQSPPNNSFKPKTNRYAIVFGLTQALGHMSQVKAVLVILLLVLASVASAVPVPPFAATGEATSMVVALILLAVLLRLTPAKDWSFARRATLLLGIVLARVVAEATWELAITTLPDAFFLLPRLLGADGEGAYNMATYQVFLLLGLVAVAVSACWPNNSFKPKPLRGSA